MATTVKQWWGAAVGWAWPKRAGIGVDILVAAGVYGIGDALDALIAVVVFVLAVALLLLRERTWNNPVTDVLRIPAAVLISFLALVGFDVLTNLVLDGIHLIPGAHYARVPILIGLVLAALLFGLVSYWYLRRFSWKKWPTRPTIFGWRVFARASGAVTLALLFVIALPYVYGRVTTETKPVPASKRVASELDVRIVGDGHTYATTGPELPPTPVLGEFDVSYSVGFAAGNRVRWTLVDGNSQGEALSALAEGERRPVVDADPAARAGADRVLLLLADGTAPVVEEPAALANLPEQPGEVARWRRLAAAAAPRGTPTFALLQTASRERIGAWNQFVPHGEAVSVQALGSQTATDAAVRLEVGAPTSEADFALAMEYRPVLLFDHEEPVPWPLSVSALFNAEGVRLCHDHGLLDGCDSVHSPIELESGGTHLQLKLPHSEELKALARRELAAQGGGPQGGIAAEGPGGPPEPPPAPPPAVGAPPAGTPPAGTVEPAPAPQASPGAAPGAPPGAGSTIYVHPVSVHRGARELLYLDYWWYLPENPVVLGGGALCGAGMVIAGVTCQNHESDWEGMTVVVDRSEAEPRVVAVQYAQHDKVIRYGWGLLRKRWQNDPEVARLVAGIGDASTRPLAFVAKGTHATYPTPCGNCHQVVDTDVSEEPHRGDLPWVGDNTDACGRSSCVQMLPTHDGGRKPALWNAYDGTWGEHDCVLTYYCDSGTPPTAPGQQKRYRHPTCVSGTVGADWRFHEATAAEQECEESKRSSKGGSLP